jgi:hypothetical protein
MFALVVAGAQGALAANTVQRGFSVTVHSSAPVQIGASPKAFTLPPAAGPRGAVTVRNALTIRAPATSGYNLRFDIADPAVRSVDVFGFAQPIHLTPGGVEIFVPAQASGPHGELTLSYAVTYAERATPSEDATPFRVTFLP